LRTIQQKDLPLIDRQKRVLGVIRPTTEIIGSLTKTNKVGILGTVGTVQSNSYPIEIANLFPEVEVFQQECPMWVPLIENGEYNNAGADFFVKKYLDELLQKNAQIDTILLACTHYPVLIEKIKSFLPTDITIVSQGNIVANALKSYLQNHPTIMANCSQNKTVSFFTTDSTADFDKHATDFYGSAVHSKQVIL
jgi:glutamate racemase